MAPKPRKSVARGASYRPPRALRSPPKTVASLRPRRANKATVNYDDSRASDDDNPDPQSSTAVGVESDFEPHDHQPSEYGSDLEEDMDGRNSEVEQPKAKKRKLTRSVPVPAPPKSRGKSRTKSGPNPDEVANAPQTPGKASRMRKLYNNARVLKEVDLKLAPLSSINDIFLDITKKAVASHPVHPNLVDAVKHLGARPLRVATMCSGTESPLLALEMLRDSLQELSYPDFRVEHVFSAEIEPFKQAYIERNFHPPIIFRDIVEIVNAKDTKEEMATTAYGALVKIPKDVDVVIAGTACVDFSRLNTKPKTLEEKGESGDTFDAVLAYADTYRPAILILENVCGAPWNEMLARYEAIGYEVAGVLVDTKNFYLPQTRQRGYMICIDKEKTPPDVKAGQLSEWWQDIMEEMRRQVSAPISDFLLPDDDARVVRSRQRSARQGLLDVNLRAIDWAKCEIRHTDYRRNSGLGNGRPLTEWQESGTTVLPEHYDKAWYKSQPERVWDFMDMSLLRQAKDKEKETEKEKKKERRESAKEKKKSAKDKEESVTERFDVQFKTRVWDVSQNIDRFNDTAPFGISSCLTPAGIFYLSDRGGPLLDVESLITQGLPLDKISFTTETSRQIQDLAGNAMSSSVIGSAIAAALMVGHEVLKADTDSDPRYQKAEPTPAIDGILGFNRYRKSEKTDSKDIDMALFLEEAQRSSRKCQCEGQINVVGKPIQTCLECNHTSCITCGIKPIHKYDDPQHLARDTPEDFIQKWRRYVPMQVQFGNTDRLAHFLGLQTTQGTMPANRYLKAVGDAVSCAFTFRELRRSSYWVVKYESPYAKLELLLDGELSGWRLYVKPESSLPGNSVERVFFQQPVAKSTVDDCGIYGKHWDWRIPGTTTTKVDIARAKDNEDVPSWSARLGIPQYRDEVVPSHLQIQLVSPHKLETDVSGLYKHLPDCGTASSSMYKRIDASDSRDLFFFLDPGKITDPKDDSFVFAFDHSRLPYGQVREIVCSIDAHWRPWRMASVKPVSAKSEGSWVHEERCELVPTSDKPTFAIYRGPLVHPDCSIAKAVASCEFKVPDKTEARFLGVHQIQPDDKAFFETFNWALEPLRRDLGYNVKHVIENCFPISCNECAPPLPEVRWNLAHKGKTQNKIVFRPYEDSRTATAYEVALKNRPHPFVVQSHIKRGKATIHIGVGILSLGQRAVGKLSRLTNKFDSVSWSLDTTFSSEGPISAPKFSLRSNDQDVHYDRDIFGSKLTLFEEQQRSLGWMRNQEEVDGRRFTLKEVEEAILPHLGWRLETEATGTEHVRGGILADHAGFGKTIMSLGLIHSEFLDRGSAANIVANMKDMEKKDPLQIMPRKIAATLVICPKNLVAQWKDEVIKVLGQAYEPLTIAVPDLRSLQKSCSVGRFEKARIILVNRELLDNEQYRKRLAVFGGVPECRSSGSREVRSWLEMATRNLPAHLDLLQKDGLNALKARLEDLYTRHLENKDLRTFAEQSKRAKGEDYMKKKSGQAQVKAPEVTMASLLEARPTLHNDELKSCVLFEMFHFNRIIIDEFSYLGASDLYTFGAIKADKRWGLSATPQLKDPYDVSRMANLLGLRLPVGASAHGLMSDKNMRALRVGMTNLEEFETFRDAPSRVVQEKVHSLAQNFLDIFVRQNILDSKKWTYNDFLLPIVLNADHRVLYTEASQKLNSQDMRIRKGKKVGTNYGTATSAEEVLLKEAALCIPKNQSAKQGGTASSSLAAVLEDRLEIQAEASRAVRDKTADCRRLAMDLKMDECHFQSWADSIENNILGDQSTTDEISTMIGVRSKKRPLKKISESVSKSREDSEEDDPEQVSARPSGDFEDDPDEVADSASGSSKKDEEDEEEKAEPETPAGLATKISKANQMAKTYVTSARSVRFVQKACELDEHRSNGKSLPVCEGCHNKHSSLEDLSVSAACGHVICTPCFEASKRALGKCSANGCEKEIRSYHLLGFDKIGDVANSKHGKKADVVVDLLRRIKEKEQKAILFIQYDEQIKKVVAKLEEENVRHATAQNSNAIKRFQTDPAITVLVLNSSDVSAAGMNLTAANHVVFFSPLLKETQYEYDAQMAQGVGRVRRHGQRNPISVYRVTSLDTIDVDILEQRERRTDMLVETTIFDADAAQTGGGGGGKNKLNSKRVGRLDEPERTQMIRDPGDGSIKLVPKSLLLDGGNGKVQGTFRVKGYKDFSALVKFSRAFAADDDD